MADKKFTPLTDSDTSKKKPSGLPAKEVEPPVSSSEEKFEQVVEFEPEIEVQPHVEVRKEKVELPPELKDLGAIASETTDFPTHQDIKLPLSDPEIEKGLSQPVTSSFRWLAEFCIYLLKHAHIAFKTVHGKLTRTEVKT